MAKRRRNWDWPRISGWFVLLFAPARADARFARTKGDYVRMLLQCLLGIPVSMSPAFVALFQTNMQKYALEGGEALTGQAALQDTMGDLIVDFIGALAIAIAGYLSRKRGKGNRSPRPERHKRRGGGP